ncbi:hypothetical protein MKW94_001380 [Papaver nudicaule]|uniref:N-acetyltransferase domain-containing protein n=1 Tax=Papaver nudicaule TaxID=74823 RepID=A0AA41VN15_PAPNU|nr:hypothetical protein [Papaver nudicaule]
MDHKVCFVPQFRGVQLLPISRVIGERIKCNPLVCDLRVSSAPFWDSFPVLYTRWKNIRAQCNESEQSTHQSSVSRSDNVRLPELAFDRLQLSDDEYCGIQTRGFGNFVARGAVLDEEYWTAAWLRAEAHYESLPYMRHVDSFKRKYAEQEFCALKKRCSQRDGNSLKCFCLVSVKKEDKNVKCTVLKSIVGTLDLSIRQFLPGETFPGEVKKPSTFLASHGAYGAHRYAYIANVCVSKFARRRGIASNMLYLASDLATTTGIKQLFVHVNFDNNPAQELYKKVGFEMVEAASSPLANDQRLLMSMQL